MQTQHWRTSTFSLNGGTGCVGVTVLSGGQVGFCDSEHSGAGHVTFTRAGMTAWIQGVKVGEDHVAKR